MVVTPKKSYIVLIQQAENIPSIRQQLAAELKAGCELRSRLEKVALGSGEIFEHRCRCYCYCAAAAATTAAIVMVLSTIQPLLPLGRSLWSLFCDRLRHIVAVSPC